MASLNTVSLIGNVGKDPELKYSASGVAVCNISLATTRSWKDKTSGDKQEETEWHRVVFYDRLAAVVGEWVKKGKSIYVEGRLKTRKWQNKEGQDIYTTEIIASEMQMLGGRDEASAPRSAPAAAPKPAAQPSAGFDEFTDSIPF
jgi:single-strand DNA-binding protein